MNDTSPLNGNIEDDDKEVQEEEWHLPSSPILATRYAHRSSKLIYSIEKNFHWLIGLVGLLFVLSLLDLLRINHIFGLHIDTPITILLAISMIALGFTFRSVLKSRRMLESWADMFERNSIRAGLDISMANKSKEEAVQAIAEAVEEIGDPLREYICYKENFNEFLNVLVGKSDSSNGSISDGSKDNVSFDVLIDSGHVIPISDNNKEQISNNLVEALKDYGAIIIRIIDGKISNDTIVSFSKQLHSYTSLTKNKVHLAVLMGDDATEEAYKQAIKSEKKGKIDFLVVVEKPPSSLLIS